MATFEVTTETTAAYMAGRTVGRANGDPLINPHPKGLFVDSSLWEAWTTGWKDGRDARARNARKRVRAWNRA